MSKKITNPTVETTNEVSTKVTPVNERKYALSVDRPQVKSKQASIVLDILAASSEPLTIDEIAPIASDKGLKAVGGVAPSVRYHLHMLTKDNVTHVTNPTIEIV